MFAWLRRLFRHDVLPVNPMAPVKVDFIGRVVSPNTTTSPITHFTGAMLDIALVDVEVVLARQSSFESREVERFILLGGLRYGEPLLLEDAQKRRLLIESFSACSVIPLSPRPLVLDSPVPPELFEIAARSQHMLSYREVRFRTDDRVRVVATVRSELRRADLGYRDGSGSEVYLA